MCDSLAVLIKKTFEWDGKFVTIFYKIKHDKSILKINVWIKKMFVKKLHEINFNFQLKNSVEFLG